MGGAIEHQDDTQHTDHSLCPLVQAPDDEEGQTGQEVHTRRQGRDGYAWTPERERESIKGLV